MYEFILILVGIGVGFVVWRLFIWCGCVFVVGVIGLVVVFVVGIVSGELVESWLFFLWDFI